MKSTSTKKSCLIQHLRNLTKAEKDILSLLLAPNFLTPNKIALRRRCSPQAIHKHLSNLKKKGILNCNFQMVEKKQGTQQPFNQIRLHGQEFNIKILFKDERYKKALMKCNTLFVDGNTVRLYQDSIEIYSGLSFFSDTASKATIDSFKYWQRLIVRLENDLKIILLKPRSNNIKLVKQHYAHTDNELAKECNASKEKIKVFTTDDHKLWFTIDQSFSFDESETVHPVSAQKDMNEIISPFLNDLRDNNPPTLSEIMTIIKTMAKQNSETAAGLNAIVQMIRPQSHEPNPIKKKLDYIG